MLSVSDTCPGVRAGLAAGSAQSIIPYNRSGRLDGHSFRRIELLTGAPRGKSQLLRRASRREQWQGVTQRYGRHRNQLYDWRREL